MCEEVKFLVRLWSAEFVNHPHLDVQKVTKEIEKRKRNLFLRSLIRIFIGYLANIGQTDGGRGDYAAHSCRSGNC